MTIYIFEPELCDKRGHFYEYNRSLLVEFQNRGMIARLYCHAKPATDIVETLKAIPTFSDVSWTKSIKIPSISYFVVFAAVNISTFFGLIRKAYDKYSKSDVCLFTSPTMNNLFGVALWYLLLPRKHKPSLVILLRLPYYGRLTHAIPLTPKLYRIAFHFLNRIAGNRVHYLSDSSILAKEYGNMADRDVAVAPIPHIPEEKYGIKRSSPYDKACFVYLGIARAEKGFFLLGEAIRVLERFGKVACYRIQTMDPTESPSVSEAKGLLSGLNGVELLPGNLQTDSYYDVLSSADCVLIPYDPCDYLGRTSGIFAEAVAFGKPVITTDRTWMADHVRKLGCGVVMPEFRSDDLAAAMLDYLGNRTDFDRRAEEAARVWRKQNGARQYVDFLMNLVGEETRSRPTDQGVVNTGHSDTGMGVSRDAGDRMP